MSSVFLKIKPTYGCKAQHIDAKTGGVGKNSYFDRNMCDLEKKLEKTEICFVYECECL